MDFRVWIETQLFLEHRLDWYTTIMSRAIMSAFKNNLKLFYSRAYLVFHHGRPAHPYSEDLNLDPAIPHIRVLIAMSNSSYPQVKASYDYYNKEIDITIHTSLQKHSRSELLELLKSSIRHELEHTAQDPESLKTTPRITHGFESIKAYFLHPNEIAAYATSLVKQAKFNKMPIERGLANFMGRFAASMEARGLTDEESKYLTKEFGDRLNAYIQKRYNA